MLKAETRARVNMKIIELGRFEWISIKPGSIKKRSNEIKRSPRFANVSFLLIQ